MKTIISYSFLFLLFAFSCTGEKTTDNLLLPKPVIFEDLIIKGELETRIHKNFDRMEEAKYKPDSVFLTNEESNWWPGDTEGRTVMALVLDARATHRTPKYLDEILSMFPDEMNEKGYFGDIHPDTIFDEQQFSSHGWVLRGLCEYYDWKKDEKTLVMIEKMIENYALPSLGYHESSYPTDPAKREHAGSFSGTRHSKMYNNWILSTDIGCDFIFLDGIVHAYEILRTEELRALIDEMIEVFLSIDLYKIKAQTHATLTALRAMGRYYEIIHDPVLLAAIIERFDLYVSKGMTENYENYNWFQRPKWTEPCAIIDSYIDAVNLWKYTGNAKYLEYAHHILYNGIYVTQRKNGGFGCNTCTGSKNPFIKVSAPESHWCCTMRGGEGLSRAAEYLYFTNGDTIIIPFFNDNEAILRFGDEYIKLSETTKYPHSGEVNLKILESTLSFKPIIKMIAPKFTEKQSVILNEKAIELDNKNGFVVLSQDLNVNDEISYQFDLKLRAVPTFNPNTIEGYQAFHYGPLMLGLETEKEIIPNSSDVIKIDELHYKLGEGIILSPLHHIMDSVWWDLEYKQQVLFKKD